MTGLVNIVRHRLNGIKIQAVITLCPDAYSKRMDVSRLNYADVASLVAMKAIGGGHEWSVLATSYLMLLMNS